jgi:ABC-type nickel/cobalt efflux system permease component RcnA
MKVASIISGVVFAIYAILLLVQVWSEAMLWEVFMKLTVTAAVIIIATFGLAMLYREYIEEKTMKDDKYID